MAFYKSRNPALKKDTFTAIDRTSGEDVMTINGTVNKIAFLGAIVFLFAMVSWYMFFDPNYQAYTGILAAVGGIGGFIVAIVISFKKTSAPYLAPVYAALEGLMLGAISAYFEMAFNGIVLNAILLTLSVLGGLLIIYKLRLIAVTKNFKLMVGGATMGIAFFYLISFVGGFFGFNIPFIHQGGTFGIIFSLFVVAIAALNLVIDFDFIEEGAEQGAPKYMEWYGAFGLMVTLIWLYIEILRLLAKLRSND